MNSCNLIVKERRGYLLVEVLIAIALFGFAAFYVVEAAFTANRFSKIVRDDRALEADLRASCSRIALKSEKHDEFEEGGEFEGMSMGMIEWLPTIEGTKSPHLYKVTLEINYDGNSDLGIESGQRTFKVYYFRPKWAGQNSDRRSDKEDAVDHIEREFKEFADENKRIYRSWKE